MQLSKFLDELEEMAYITNVQTDELVFLNRTGRQLLQQKDDYKGKLCYQVLYGREKPCKDCPRNMLRKDAYLVRKQQIAVCNKPCTKKDKLIEYEGKMCHLQVQHFQKEGKRENKNKDRLTDLLIGVEGKRVIESYLRTEQENGGYLFLIDLDNFRKINELYGFYFGDVVMKELAELVSSFASREDVVVRYGGDEVLVFLKEVSKEQAYEFGNCICTKVRDLYKNDRNQGIVTCSIGMMSADVVGEYDELVRYAQQALDYVKHYNKGNVVSYMDMMEEWERLEDVKYTKNSQIRAMRPYGAKEKEILNFAKNLLEKSKRLKDAIYILLAKIGREYGLSRITILENDYDYMCSNVLYQWSVQENTTDALEKFVLDEELHSSMKAFFKKNGYFIMDHSLLMETAETPQEKISQLVCEFHDKEKLRGFSVYECAQMDVAWPLGVCEVLWEISNLIAVYQRRESMNREFKEKAEFLSSISHEIRTPMNAIYGWANIAKEHVADESLMKECLQKIDTSSKYLLNVMDEILDVKNMEEGNFDIEEEPFSVQEIYHEIQCILQQQMDKKQIKGYFVSANKEQRFLGDRKHIQQILVNVIGYIIRNTEKNTSITLHTIENKKNMLQFGIESTGEYDLKEIEQLLSVFSEEERFYDNLGNIDFPLLVAVRFVKWLGGHIKIEKNQLVWSFLISLPIKAGQYTVHKEKRQYDFSGKKLLLVEDNDLNVEVAQALLEVVGFEVDVAENGKVAVEKFQQVEPGVYDAILMDIRMPIMDGLEATRQIRNLGKKDSRTISIVALSANAHDEDAKKSIANGMNGHLAKPIEVNSLYQMLEQLIM